MANFIYEVYRVQDYGGVRAAWVEGDARTQALVQRGWTVNAFAGENQDFFIEAWDARHTMAEFAAFADARPLLYEPIVKGEGVYAAVNFDALYDALWNQNIQLGTIRWMGETRKSIAYNATYLGNAFAHIDFLMYVWRDEPLAFYIASERGWELMGRERVTTLEANRRRNILTALIVAATSNVIQPK